jgi:ABC-type uncharacterized transport system permease subunit
MLCDHCSDRPQVLPGSSIPSNHIAIIIVIATKTTDHGLPSREIVLNLHIYFVRSSIRMVVAAAAVIGYCWKSSAKLRLVVLPLAMMTLALLTKILVTPSCTFLAMSKIRYSSLAWVVRRPTTTTRVGDGTTITRIGSSCRSDRLGRMD